MLSKVIKLLQVLCLSVLLAGCAEYLVVEAVGNVVYHGAKAISEMSESKPVSKSSTVSKSTAANNRQTGCVISSKYHYFAPEYCRQRGGTVTDNFNVECRYLKSDLREITQEWRCKQQGGYVYTAVSPNTVTGVMKAQVATKSVPASVSAPAREAEGMVQCELKQSGVITGYVEVSAQTCRDLTGG